MAERRAAASAALVPSIAVITSPWGRPGSDAGPPLATVRARPPPLVAAGGAGVGRGAAADDGRAPHTPVGGVGHADAEEGGRLRAGAAATVAVAAAVAVAVAPAERVRAVAVPAEGVRELTAPEGAAT